MTNLGNSHSILDDRIIVFHGAIKDFQHLIDLAEATSWTDNFNDGYPDGLPHRFETEIVITDDTPKGATILESLSGVLDEYATLINSNVDASIRRVGSPWSTYISKYSVGGRVGVHSDENYTEDNGIYSIILYLNDNYDSGEVVFVNHKATIKPSAGDVLIFPSYYLHYSNPVENGYKYMSIFRLNFNN